MPVRILARVAAVVVFIAFAPRAHADDAAIDTTFGPVTSSSPAGWRRAYVAAGGTVDERIVAAQRTPDGGYLLAGSRAGGAAGALIFLAKFRPDGSYDGTFGGSVVNGTAGSGRVLKDAYLSSVHDMTVDSQGRVVVVGSTPGALGQADFGVVRFKPDGSDDSSFAGDGGTGVAFDRDAAHGRVSDVPNSVATLPDGSVLVAGTIAEYTSSSTTVVGIVKLKPDGSIDSAFSNGGNGREEFCLAQCDNVISLARIVYDAPRNRIVLGGDYTAGTNDSNWFIITQYLGTPMASQTYSYAIDLGGASGYQLAYATSLAVQADGKILVTGWANTASLATRAVVLRRQTSSVAEDTGFGNIGGRGLFVGAYDGVIYNDLAVDALGRIVLAGSYGGTRQGAVQRLSNTGAPDTTFNGTSDPTLYTARRTDPTIEAYSTEFKRVFLDGGRAVLAGESPDSSSANDDYDLLVARLQSDSIFASSFE